MARHVRPRRLSRSPRVSVVIPCYNYGHYLRECAGSALGQTGVTVEVVIVDAASTDDTAEVARELAATDPRVTVITQAHNGGHIHTYNEGLAAATGEYVVLLSADDLLAPGALARAGAVLDAHPGVGLVYGFAPVFVDTPPRPGRHTWSWTIWPGLDWLAEVHRRGRNVIRSPEAVMRTSVLRQLGGYEPGLPHTADLFLWLGAATMADVAYIAGPDQGYFRQHGANLSVVRFGGPTDDIDHRRQAFELFAARFADRLPPGAQPRDDAARALGDEALARACLWLDRGPRAGDDPTALAALAHELWPAIAGTRQWRAYEHSLARWRSGRRRRVSQLGRAAIDQWGMNLGQRFGLRRFLPLGVRVLSHGWTPR